MESFIEEEELDEPREGAFEESDKDQMQCDEGDRILSHMSRSHESPEGSQEEPVPGYRQEKPVPGSSQRDQRQDKHKTKQQNVNEALFEAQKDAEDIRKRKLAGNCPSPPKKERSTESKSHVWKIFKLNYVEGKKYTQCNFCS